MTTFSLTQGLQGTDLTEDEKRMVRPDFGPVGSSRPRSSKPNLPPDFNGTATRRVDHLGMALMQPGQFPPIPHQTDWPPEPEAASHPQQSRLWNWLAPQTPSKVLNHQPEAKSKKQMQNSVELAAGPRTDVGHPTSTENAGSLTPGAQVSGSSGQRRDYNSVVKGSLPDPPVPTNDNPQVLNSDLNAKEDEPSEPSSSPSVDENDDTKPGFDPTIRRPSPTLQLSNSVSLREPEMSPRHEVAQMTEQYDYPPPSMPSYSYNHAMKAPFSVPAEYLKMYQALKAEADMRFWNAQYSCTLEDDLKEKLQAMLPPSDPLWRTQPLDLVHFGMRYEADAAKISFNAPPVEIDEMTMKYKAARVAWDFCDKRLKAEQKHHDVIKKQLELQGILPPSVDPDNEQQISQLPTPFN